MCIQARAVKNKLGLLGSSTQSNTFGKALTEGTKAKVLEFYENDEFTRVMPEAKMLFLPGMTKVKRFTNLNDFCCVITLYYTMSF